MTNHKQRILDKIDDRSARVAVIGLGYVGLPLAVGFAQAGFRTIGIDVDSGKVAALNAGQSYIGDVPAADVAALVASGRLAATTDFDSLSDCDAVSICVPTPLSKTHDPDLSYVIAAAEQAARHVHAGMLIVLESTTYPGTTEEIIVPRLVTNGFRVGEDVFVAFSPERVDPGRTDFTLRNTPKVVGGQTGACLEVVQALYGCVAEKLVPVSSTAAAEMVKLLENTFRAVNIALVNEFLTMCDKLGLDAWEIVDAAATKPYGFMRFTPGPGVGGHCLAGKEMVRYRWGEENGVIPLEALFGRASGRSRRTFNLGGMHFLVPDKLEVLSIEPSTGAQSWQPVTYLFEREYEGTFVDIQTTDNRRLTVTDRHPMLVHDQDGLQVREAIALQPGDLLPLVLHPGETSGDKCRQLEVIHLLPAALAVDVRVRHPRGWKHASAALRPILGDRLDDVVTRYNSLPLAAWRQLPPELQGEPRELVLVTGRGPAQSSFPAIIEFDPDFGRLIGYYLSEGCISQYNGRPRLRLTFNRDEVEYLDEVRALCARLGLRVSEFNDSQWHSTTVKVAGWLLPWLLRDVLHTGVNAQTMRVPDALMASPLPVRVELLKGLLRGDGDVHLQAGKHPYRKDGHQYNHENNSAEVGYFSSSPELFEQVKLLLQEFGWTPGFRPVKPHLRFKVTSEHEQLEGWFLGDKARRLAQLRASKQRPSHSRRPQPGAGYAVARVKSVHARQDRTHVYSLEVRDTHTFAATSGIYVHNCIPLDPQYLSWKLRTLNYNARFIQLAEEVNAGMPAHWVNKVAEALNRDRKAMNGSRVLVLGVTYKPDVGDLRESPALDIIELLEARGALVSFHDPFITSLRHDGLETPYTALTAEAVAGADCVMIVTDHADYNWAWVQAQARPIVDTRHALRRAQTKLQNALNAA